MHSFQTQVAYILLGALTLPIPALEPPLLPPIVFMFLGPLRMILHCSGDMGKKNNKKAGCFQFIR